jgi:hypothetical protein
VGHLATTNPQIRDPDAKRQIVFLGWRLCSVCEDQRRQEVARADDTAGPVARLVLPRVVPADDRTGAVFRLKQSAYCLDAPEENTVPVSERVRPRCLDQLLCFRDSVQLGSRLRCGSLRGLQLILVLLGSV